MLKINMYFVFWKLFMHVFLGFKRKEEMYYSTLAELHLEEEENGATSSSPSFSSSISTRRKAMLPTCKKKKLTCKECLLHYMSSIKIQLESAYSKQNTPLSSQKKSFCYFSGPVLMWWMLLGDSVCCKSSEGWGVTNTSVNYSLRNWGAKMAWSTRSKVTGIQAVQFITKSTSNNITQ